MEYYHPYTLGSAFTSRHSLRIRVRGEVRLHNWSTIGGYILTELDEMKMVKVVLPDEWGNIKLGVFAIGTTILRIVECYFKAVAPLIHLYARGQNIQIFPIAFHLLSTFSLYISLWKRPPLSDNRALSEYTHHHSRSIRSTIFEIVFRKWRAPGTLSLLTSACTKNAVHSFIIANAVFPWLNSFPHLCIKPF